MKYYVYFMLGLLLAAIVCLGTSGYGYELGSGCEKAQDAVRKCLSANKNCERLIRNSFVACKFKERK